MKMTRAAAIAALNGFAVIDAGRDGKPFDIEFEPFMRIVAVMNKLKDAVTPYQKAQQVRQRLLNLDRPAFEWPKDASELAVLRAFQVKEASFMDVEQKLLEATISIKMPKTRFKQSEFKPDKNKIPATALNNIRPFVDFDEIAMDDDADDFSQVDPAPAPEIRAAE